MPQVPKFVNASGTVDAHTVGRFHIVHGKLACANKYLMPLPQKETDRFQINEVGWLLDDVGNVIAQPDNFCLEQFSESNYQVLPVVCSPQRPIPQLEDEKQMFSTIGMILSLPFLFSTFLVYALIKDLRNLHGKSLMCHVATLLIAYTSLIVIQFITNDIDSEWCVVLGESIFLFCLFSTFNN